MPNDSKTEFISNLKKSGAIDADRLAEWLDVTKAETASKLAKYLVRDELLTKWQAKYLLSGRSRLEIASYKLLERTARDKLGDRFLAVHTSLNRKVDLQVFSSELTKDESRCKPFLKKASQIAKLDHPNLIHAYDIDQEGGRYFLVTEHVAGTTLDLVPRSKIAEDDVARILNQALNAITHAHENDIVHGCIKQSDLILVDNRHLKIQNLAVSPLCEDSEPEPKSDFKAIKKIAVSLLKEIPEKKRTEKYRDLVKVLNAFDYKDPESIEATSSALTNWVGSDDLELASADDLFSNDGSSPEGSFDRPTTGTVSKSLGRKNKSAESDDQTEQEDEAVAQPGYAGRLWQNNPVAFIATVAVLGLGLIGGSALGIRSYFNSASLTAVAAKDQSRTNVVNRPSADEADADKSVTRKAKDPQNKGVTKFSKPVLNSSVDLGPLGDKQKVPAGTAVRFLGDESGGFVEIEVELPENKTAIGWVDSSIIADADATVIKAVQSSPQLAAKKTETDLASSAGNIPASEPANRSNDSVLSEQPIEQPEAASSPAQTANNRLLEINGIGPKYAKHLNKAGVKTLQQIAAMSGSDIQAALLKGGWRGRSKAVEGVKWITQAKEIIGDKTPIKESVVATKAPAKKAPVVDLSTPFKRFPRVTDLPPITDTNEFKIAPLKINQSYLLGAEMICEPGVSKTKLIFEMSRTPEDKQKWLVGVKRRAKEKPAIIAAFRKSPDAFFFQWLPEAAENKYSEFLRNCFVKLKTPHDETTYLTLRKPILIPDLRFTAENMTNQAVVDIPALPNLENIVIEVLQPKIKGLSLRPYVLQIEPRRPGKIELSRNDKGKGMWIQISGGIRNKLQLQTNVMAMHQGREAPMSSLEEISGFIANFQQIAGQLAEINDAKQKEKAAKGQSRKSKEQNAVLSNEKAELARQAKAAQSLVDRTVRYKDILSKAANQPLHVRVYAKFGDLQTQLVRTDAKLPQPAPESRKKRKK